MYKMCMSIGWNPFYKNEQKTVEPWILHKFDQDFYGQTSHHFATGLHCSTLRAAQRLLPALLRCEGKRLGLLQRCPRGGGEVGVWKVVLTHLKKSLAL